MSNPYFCSYIANCVNATPTISPDASLIKLDSNFALLDMYSLLPAFVKPPIPKSYMILPSASIQKP